MSILQITIIPHFIAFHFVGLHRCFIFDTRKASLSTSRGLHSLYWNAQFIVVVWSQPVLWRNPKFACILHDSSFHSHFFSVLPCRAKRGLLCHVLLDSTRAIELVADFQSWRDALNQNVLQEGDQNVKNPEIKA